MRLARCRQPRVNDGGFDALGGCSGIAAALLRGAETFCRAHETQYLRLLSDMDIENEALRALANAGIVG